MRFKSIQIKNFRNYQDIILDLNNKNIIFGRNDFGKTNFLHALRFLFDPKVRNKGFQETDYYKRKTDEPIYILLKIKLSDDSDDDEFIRSKVGGNIEFSKKGEFYIQLKGVYSEDKQIGNPTLQWGGSLDELKQIQAPGIYSDLDYIFEVVYLHPNISPDELFKQHRNLLYKDKSTSKNQKINKAIEELNQIISKDSRVQRLNELLTTNYQDIRKEDIEVILKSEHEIHGVFNHLIPYIQDLELEEPDERPYPTSGDGRRKILAYALTNLIERRKLEENEVKRIPIYLIEEVENSLHPSMQQIVSRNIFETNKDVYKYLFVTTHSEHMFKYMNDVNLIRIYRKSRNTHTSKSLLYKVPDEYSATRMTLNELLAQGFFYDKVLLVEGMSEKILFEAILEKIVDNHSDALFNIERVMIISVEGIGFQRYVELMHEIGIEVLVKTDNDLRKKDGQSSVSLLGINRCNRLFKFYNDEEYVEKSDNKNEKLLENEIFSVKKIKDSIKRRIFQKNLKDIRNWKKHNIFLSEIELEEDLYEVLKENKYNPDDYYNKGFTEFLQDSKKMNMNKFVNKQLNYEMAKTIYNSNQFECLRNLLGFDLNE